MNETLMQVISVMLIGMGTVVAFLCITILSMFVMSFIVGKLNKLFPENKKKNILLKHLLTSPY